MEAITSRGGRSFTEMVMRRDTVSSTTSFKPAREAMAVSSSGASTAIAKTESFWASPSILRVPLAGSTGVTGGATGGGTGASWACPTTGARQSKSATAKPRRSEEESMNKLQPKNGLHSLMITKDFLREATDLLMSEARLPRAEAHLQARLLLDNATNIRFSHLVAPEATLEPTQHQKLQLWLTEAIKGRPIPYILNSAPFFGLEFAVDERVLIPRPETELLVELAIERLKNRTQPKIADLGTGSGAIAVSVAHSLPSAQVYALDISPGALEVAKGNSAANNVKVEFLQGDGHWLHPIAPFAPFDAILSNPPYVPASDIEELEIGVRDFEPRLALDGGDDGLTPYRELAAGAKE
ncbi:peptide chain release factor N(5)-glutamine methyltransferase, partial [bacterium]